MGNKPADPIDSSLCLFFSFASTTDVRSVLLFLATLKPELGVYSVGALTLVLPSMEDVFPGNKNKLCQGYPLTVPSYHIYINFNQVSFLYNVKFTWLIGLPKYSFE